MSVFFPLPLLWRDSGPFADYHGLVYLSAIGEFTVDGIRYDPLRHADRVHQRPMFELERDGGGATRMTCDDPMTEEELDRYVRTGRFRQQRYPLPERTPTCRPDSVTARSLSSV